MSTLSGVAMLGCFFIRKGSLDRVLNSEQTFEKGSSNSG